MVFLIKALQLILCFCILIALHELGHFTFAKIFKIRVSKFCLFFDPWRKKTRQRENGTYEYGWKSCGWRLFTWRGTDFCIGWLPLGGYVNIEGMVDESKSVEEVAKQIEGMSEEEKSQMFFSKPAWQRLLVMVGGVLVNFLLAFFIYAMCIFTWGEEYVPMEEISNGFAFNAEAKALGFQDGDILLGTDTKTFQRFDSSESIGDVYRALSVANQATVLRNGQKVTIEMPGNLDLLNMMKSQPMFAMVFIPSHVDSCAVNGPAAKAGITAGDKILAFNGKPVASWNDINYQIGVIADQVEADKKTLNKLRNVSIVVLHKNATSPDTLTLKLSDDLKLGVVYKLPMADYKRVKREYDIVECWPAGIHRGWNVLSGYVSDLKYLFTKEGAKSVGSFGTIGSLFPATWDWMRFWELTAFISLMLAFMNFLPIPALDGGYILFLLCEIVTRKKLPDSFLEKANTVGMFLLLILMVYAIFNDVIRLAF